MTLWLLLVVVGQMLLALVALFDKFIVTDERAVPRPLVYAFYVCILSSLSIVVFLFSWIPLPFEDLSMPSLANVERPTLLIALLSLVAGYTFFQALVSLFSALKSADASEVVPVVGAMSALATFLLSYLFLDAVLSASFLVGFLLLIVGTLFMSHFRFTWNVGLLALHAGLFFAVHYVAIKILFTETSFDNGFFWSRFGMVFIALSLLLVPRTYEKIALQTKATGRRGGLLVVVNKALAGLASLLLLKAIELGDVSVVQALGGLQYAFLLIVSVLMGHRLAEACGERCSPHETLYKTIAIVLIVLGFFVLFL